MNNSPIFVGGLDRSGKTLLCLALSSHPNIVMTRRTYMWRHFHNQFGNLSDRSNFERCLSAMLERKAVHILEPKPDRIRKEFWESNEHTYARLFSLLHEHYAERMGKTRWGEQEGSIEHYARQIFEEYPNARVIHLIRDPRARYGDELKSLGRRLGMVGSRTADWLASIQLAAQNPQKYNDRYMILKFEQLLIQPEESLRRVCDFIQEDFSPALLTFQGTVRLRPGDEAEADHSREWSDRRVKEYLSASDVVPAPDLTFMENFAGNWMTTQGYPLTNKPLTLAQRLLYYIIWPVNFIRLNRDRLQRERNLI